MSIRIGPLLAGLVYAALLPAQLLTRQDSHKVSSGYAFVSPMASNHSFLITNTGEIVKKWTGSAAGAVAVLTEAAVRGTVLSLRGIDTTREFVERQHRMIEQGGTD